MKLNKTADNWVGMKLNLVGNTSQKFMASNNEIYNPNFDFLVISRLMYLIVLYFLLDVLK